MGNNYQQLFEIAKLTMRLFMPDNFDRNKARLDLEDYMANGVDDALWEKIWRAAQEKDSEET